MFSDMVAMLKRGEMPDLHQLRKRFDRALVKKIGVVNTPYSFWSSDPKINPLTRDLVWASILLEDKENFNLLAGIASTEMHEKRRASGRMAQMAGTGPAPDKITGAFIDEFLNLPREETFRNILKEKIARTTN